MSRARVIAVAAVMLAAPGAPAAPTAAVNTSSYRDGHTRPRALAYNPDDGLLYVALSTSDEVAIVDAAAAPPRVLTRQRICGFPDAIGALPGGGAVVACRFDAGLRRLRRAARGGWRVGLLAAGPEAGARGLAVAPGGAHAYVASPAVGGIKVVSLSERGGLVQTVATGISPRALRILPAGTL